MKTLRISSLITNLDADKHELYEKAAKRLNISTDEILDLMIIKKSIDDKFMDNICFKYIIDVTIASDSTYMLKHIDKDISFPKKIEYTPTIIKHKKKEAFFLVLTPSCDLVKRPNKEIKAGTILCAKCNLYDKSKIRPYLKAQKAGMCEMCQSNECISKKPSCDTRKENEYHEQKVQQFTSMLNTGIVGKYFVLPKIGTIIPDLLVDFKTFHLITPEHMDNYDRIVSIDSPFREQMSWSFISLTGRPGVPDRDFSTWATENV